MSATVLLVGLFAWLLGKRHVDVGTGEEGIGRNVEAGQGESAEESEKDFEILDRSPLAPSVIG